MIIDCHSHAEYLGFTVNQALENMDQYGISKAWLLTLETLENEFDPFLYHNSTFGNKEEGAIPFSTAVKWFERAPDRFVLGYGIDPRRPEAIDRLKAAMDLYDVRVYGEIMLRMTYDNPDALNMFDFCGKNGLPVIVEVMYPYPNQGGSYPRSEWWYGGSIEAYERAIIACPDTIFFGHGPGIWAHISNDEQYLHETYPAGPVRDGGKLEKMMRKYQNFYCDLSANSCLNALKRDSAYAKYFLTEFQDRSIYGRDNFSNNLQEFISSLNLSEEIQNKIYFKNALKLIP
jgi:uncharacterized protein